MGKQIIMKRIPFQRKKHVLFIIVTICVISGIALLSYSLFYYSPIDYPTMMDEHLGDWDGGYSSDVTIETTLEYAFQVRQYAIQKFDEYLSYFDKCGLHYYSVYYDKNNEVWMVKADTSRSKKVMGGVYWIAIKKDGRILKMWGEK